MKIKQSLTIAGSILLLFVLSGCSDNGSSNSSGSSNSDRRSEDNFSSGSNTTTSFDEPSIDASRCQNVPNSQQAQCLLDLSNEVTSDFRNNQL